MQQEPTRVLFQYWNRLRDGRAAPKRSEVEPADIRSLLADTFILESDMRGEAVFRLAGTRLCATYGRELKGYSFPSIWRGKDQRMLSRLLLGVFTDRSVATIDYTGISQRGRSMKFEMLLLPLDAGAESARSLGISTALEGAYWLGSDPIVDADVAGVRVFDPEREPLFLKTRPSLPIAPESYSQAAQIVGAGAMQQPRRVKHLLVMDGGLTN